MWSYLIQHTYSVAIAAEKKKKNKKKKRFILVLEYATYSIHAWLLTPESGSAETVTLNSQRIPGFVFMHTWFRSQSADWSQMKSSAFCVAKASLLMQRHSCVEAEAAVVVKEKNQHAVYLCTSPHREGVSNDRM